MPRWLLCLALVPLSGCFNGLLLRPCQCNGPLDESVVCKADSCLCCAKIAIIDVEGVILNATSSGLLGDGENPVALFHEKLEAAACDKHVKAVVVRINSPGGAVTASDIMYQDLKNFRAHTGKPVVACMMDVAASGGYYLAMASDLVIAHPTTVTGSIGVIMSLYNAHGLFEKIGLQSNPVKSGPNKDIGNPGRPMSPEERAILQNVVDRFYGQFVHVVAEGRQMPEDQVKPLADGRVYTGIEAKEVGLVDQVGHLEDAIAAAKQLACVCDAKVILYGRCEGYKGSIYSGLHMPSEIKVKLEVPGLTGPAAGAAFMYLWQP